MASSASSSYIDSSLSPCNYSFYRFKSSTSSSNQAPLLGCARLVACQSLGPLKNGGSVVGMDIKKVKVPPQCDLRVQTICADVLNFPRQKISELSPQQMGFSVVLSDMCPSVSGIATRDAALSAELGMRALNLAVGQAAISQSPDDDDDNDGGGDNSGGVLRHGDHLVIKLREGEDAQGNCKIESSYIYK